MWVWCYGTEQLIMCLNMMAVALSLLFEIPRFGTTNLPKTTCDSLIYMNMFSFICHNASSVQTNTQGVGYHSARKKGIRRSSTTSMQPS